MRRVMNCLRSDDLKLIPLNFPEYPLWLPYCGSYIGQEYFSLTHVAPVALRLEVSK